MTKYLFEFPKGRWWKAFLISLIVFFLARTFRLMSTTEQWSGMLDDASLFLPPVQKEVVGIPRLPVVAKPNPFPPLKEVQELMQQEGNQTAAQFILDFAILGFAKCGTSTMMHWLGLHPEIQVPSWELLELKQKEPWDLVNTLYGLESLSPNLLRGYKSPNDIGDVRPIRLLRVFFPETKLLIGLRHPILMMQSFYNFRIQNKFDMVPFEQMSNGNVAKHHGVAMGRAEYHKYLVNLGKTNMTSNAELKLFSMTTKRGFEKGGYQPKSPNKVFLYDTEQLNDKNKTRQTQFLKDLESYLGLTQELPPPLHFVPGKKVSSEEQNERDAKKINICEKQYTQQREKLIEMGTSAQKWILAYFLASPDVMVSNPDHFWQVLESYQFDPCLKKEVNIVQNKSGFGV